MGGREQHCLLSVVCGLRAVCCISGGKYSAPLTAPTSPCMQKTVARYSLGGAPMVEGDDVLAVPLRSPPYDDIVASTHILNFLSPAGSVSGAVQTPLGPHHASPLPAPSASMTGRRCGHEQAEISMTSVATLCSLLTATCGLGIRAPVIGRRMVYRPYSTALLRRYTKRYHTSHDERCYRP